MPTTGDGTFTYVINSDDLAKGLRPSKHVPRNSRFLTECNGAIGLDSVLQALEDLSENVVDTSALAGLQFPFPQLFNLNGVVIVATESEIYELINGVLDLKLTIS